MDSIRFQYQVSVWIQSGFSVDSIRFQYQVSVWIQSGFSVDSIRFQYQVSVWIQSGFSIRFQCGFNQVSVSGFSVDSVPHILKHLANTLGSSLIQLIQGFKAADSRVAVCVFFLVCVYVFVEMSSFDVICRLKPI